MNDRTKLNIKTVFSASVVIILIPIIFGVPFYLLGSLIGWSFSIGEWHWVLRGILGVAYVGIVIANYVSGYWKLMERREEAKTKLGL